MKNLINIAILLLLGVHIANAQKPSPQISFTEKDFDFGVIKEEAGNVSHVFKFKNKGNSPLILNNVTASCGCTTPQWTRQPVAPNQEGQIKVTFSPAGRRGSFNKTVTIRSNASTPVVMLHIKGNITPRQKTPQEIYRRKVGPLSFRTTILPFIRLKENEVKIDSLEFMNLTDKAIKVETKRVPNHLGVKIVPENLMPGEKGYMIVNFDAQKRKLFGYVLDRIYLRIDGSDSYQYGISVSATIEEDFSHLSRQQMEDAPVPVFKEKVFDFGKIAEGQKIEHDFVLTNEGVNDLHIRRIRTTCGCTVVTPDKKIIKGGESVALKTVFNSKGKRGRNSKTITVITNSPKTTTSVLRIIGTVVPANKAKK